MASDERVQKSFTDTSANTQILQVSFHYMFAGISTKDGIIVLKSYLPAEIQSLLHDKKHPTLLTPGHVKFQGPEP